MNKEIAKEAMMVDHGYRSPIIVALGMFMIFVAAAVVLNRTLPPQYRACILMPGFCSERKEEHRSAPLADLSRLRPGPKFNLFAPAPRRY